MRLRAFAWFAAFCALMFVCTHWPSEGERHPLLIDAKVSKAFVCTPTETPKIARRTLSKEIA